MYCREVRLCNSYDGGLSIGTNIMFLDISIVLSLFKNSPVYFSKYNVSATGFYLRLQVKPTQLGPIDRASPYLRNPVSETLCFEK
jgi:hypothetical protein